MMGKLFMDFKGKFSIPPVTSPIYKSKTRTLVLILQESIIKKLEGSNGMRIMNGKNSTGLMIVQKTQRLGYGSLSP